MYFDTLDGLRAPKSYLEASPKIKSTICNGCGPKGWKAGLVPETIYGLNISEACNIHDWMYYKAETEVDRLEADLIFLTNMLRKIQSGSWWLRFLRRRRALTYYSAVREFGRV